jgi:hypothetical protein
MGLLAFLTALFESFTQGGKVAEKAMPDPEERKMVLAIEKEKLTVDERRIILRKAEKYLRAPGHKKMSVDAFAEVIFDSMNEDDKQDLKNALYELFPKRKHRKP